MNQMHEEEKDEIQKKNFNLNRRDPPEAIREP